MYYKEIVKASFVGEFIISQENHPLADFSKTSRHLDVIFFRRRGKVSRHLAVKVKKLSLNPASCIVFWQR